jgi:nucleotide-binding universal stress UspA family protein
MYIDNLIGGLAMNVVGPLPLRLLFHAFVVVVGTILLSGAVNTAIVGSNGVLNRVAEDGVLPDWLRNPHKKFGTSSNIITMIVILQIITVIITRGRIQLLGDAYAFGIVWSFAMQGLSVLVLRYKQPEQPEWKVPLNFRIGKREFPLGLALITLSLFALAVVNLFTKKIATEWGLGFTIVIFTIFYLCERHNKKKLTHPGELEKFRLDTQGVLSHQSVKVRPGNVLVAVRNPHELKHLERVLERMDTRKLDVVVLTVKRFTRQGSGGFELAPDQIFNDKVSQLFTKVVTVAEKAGKHVELLVVPGRDYNRAIVDVAQRLKSHLVVMGLSAKFTPSEQAKAFGDAWERLPAPRPQISLEIMEESTGKKMFFNLGPHPPRLWPEDVELLHRIWLDLSNKGLGHKLHHRDVVRLALHKLESLIESEGSQGILEILKKETNGHKAREKEPGVQTVEGLPPQ